MKHRKFVCLTWINKPLLFVLVLLMACGGNSMDRRTNIPLHYVIEIDPNTDEFKVTVNVNGLSKNNDSYNFVSTIPGILGETFDFGRLISGFKAYDSVGNELKIKNTSTNEWKIFDAPKARKLIYFIKDSFEEIDVSLMCGTSIDIDHSIINPLGILGYFKSLKNNPSTLELLIPDSWELGSSIKKDGDGQYTFQNFNQLADAQFLAGNLTKASTLVNGVHVDVFCYSSNNLIQAKELLDYSKDVLNAAGNFLNLPSTKQYSFLFAFRDKKTLSYAKSSIDGANASINSSLYALKEENINKSGLLTIMAHEFLHIITIHNESHYRYSDPIPSEHLWLAEGATEWASQIMLLRDKKMSVSDYFEIISNALRRNDRYDPKFSLSDIGLEILTKKGRKNYANIYYKGDIVCALLDIRLLELSNGKAGLRELLIQLYEKYGSDTNFTEDKLFEEIITMTHPEIEDFIDDYIKGSEPLPIQEYFSKLGVEYIEERVSKKKDRPLLGLLTVQENMIIDRVDKRNKVLKSGDKILVMFGQKITEDNMYKILEEMRDQKKAGETVQFEIIRNGKELTVDSELFYRTESHVLIVQDNSNTNQTKFRKRWLR